MGKPAADRRRSRVQLPHGDRPDSGPGEPKPRAPLRLALAGSPPRHASARIPGTPHRRRPSQRHCSRVSGDCLTGAGLAQALAPHRDWRGSLAASQSVSGRAARADEVSGDDQPGPVGDQEGGQGEGGKLGLIFGLSSGILWSTPKEPRMSPLNLEQKLDLLMSLATDDREGLPPRLQHTKDVGALRPLNIRNLRPLPGTRMMLLRILMTNACSYNCHYCPMRRDRPMPRTLLKPEELVRIFLEACRPVWCQGLFITTGIPGRPIKVMDDLIQVLESLRERHRFGGYIHVKLVAGSETSQIDRLTALASRVSVNFEAPCGKSLAEIAPEKSFTTTLHDFERVRKLVVLERSAQNQGKPKDLLHPGGASGMTVQFVVGATQDTDRSLLN